MCNQCRGCGVTIPDGHIYCDVCETNMKEWERRKMEEKEAEAKMEKEQNGQTE